MYRDSFSVRFFAWRLFDAWRRSVAIVLIGAALAVLRPLAAQQASLPELTGPTAVSTLPALENPPAPNESAESQRGGGAELLGVFPGKTTVAELQNHQIFQKPVQKEVSGGFLVLTYRLPDLPEMPFIQILTKNDTVEGVVVHLGQPRDLADARTSFAEAISGVDPITVTDSDGNFREIYPEKGFVFVLAKDEHSPQLPSNRVTQIIAETVKADFFTIRAAQNLKKSFALLSLSSIRSDAETALRFNPESAAAHWLLAQVAAALEDFRLAREEVIAAIRLDDSVPQYHLLLLTILERQGDIAGGERYLEAAAPFCDKPPFFRAELQILRGDFLRRSEKPDYDGAIREHRAAVELLLPLIQDETSETRVLAKKLILRAYLSLAQDIVKKPWPVPEDREKGFLWIDAASDIANSLVRDENLSSDFLLELCLGAALAGLEIPESKKSDPYLDKIPALGEILSKNCGDPLNLQAVFWRCGQALFGAFQIADMRGENGRAMAFAQESLHYLEPFCDETPQKVYDALGPVDYDFGLFFSGREQLRQESFDCFERAILMIDASLGRIDPTEKGENGIRLVNIGKAFWLDGQRQRGLELSTRGTALIEEAVGQAAFEEDELIVPLRNTALMCRKLGQTEEAQRYTDQADKIVGKAENQADSAEQAASDEPTESDRAAEPTGPEPTGSEPSPEPAADGNG